MITQLNNFVVETEGLTKHFGQRAVVEDVQLRVPRGVAFGYLGPNGAGKTTLIRMLLGLTGASGGSMRLLGHPVPAQRAEALARVGAIVEEPRFHGHLTGRENLEIVAAARGRAAYDRIDASLAEVGLAGRAGDRVRTYSLGMRQRLGIARCLIADPELLILDEPMNGLDPAGILEFRGFVRSFVSRGGTIVLSSHLLDEVEKTCDYIAIVDQGRVVVQGAIEDLRADGKPTVLIEAAELERARSLLATDPGIEAVTEDGDGVVATLRPAVEPADVNRRLVEAGVAVRHFQPLEASLEQRFLEITTRLENAA